LRFEAYLPPQLAEWLLERIEKGVFLDPREAVFVLLDELPSALAQDCANEDVGITPEPAQPPRRLSFLIRFRSSCAQRARMPRQACGSRRYICFTEIAVSCSVTLYARRNGIARSREVSPF